MWCRLAAAAPEADKLSEAIEKHMTASQIGEAKKRSIELTRLNLKCGALAIRVLKTAPLALHIRLRLGGDTFSKRALPLLSLVSTEQVPRLAR